MTTAATGSSNDAPWRSTSDGLVLVGGACEACALRFFPKRSLCPRCGGEGVGSFDLSKRGHLYSYSTIHAAPKGFQAPYTVGFVDFDEDVRVFAQIECDPNALAIGGLVEPVLGSIRLDSGSEVYSYKFRGVEG